MDEFIKKNTTRFFIKLFNRKWKNMVVYLQHLYTNDIKVMASLNTSIEYIAKCNTVIIDLFIKYITSDNDVCESILKGDLQIFEDGQIIKQKVGILWDESIFSYFYDIWKMAEDKNILENYMKNFVNISKIYILKTTE